MLPPLPLLAPLPLVFLPMCLPRDYPGLGGGGGAGRWLVSHPPVCPLGGAYACRPRQGVTLLYGPSICTRSVPMDPRRSQVLRPFPTLWSGTL